MEDRSSSNHSLVCNLDYFLEFLNDRCKPKVFQVLGEGKERHIALKKSNRKANLKDNEPTGLEEVINNNLPFFDRNGCFMRPGPLFALLEKRKIEYQIFFVFDIHKSTFTPPHLAYVLYHNGSLESVHESTTLVCAVWMNREVYSELFSKMISAIGLLHHLESLAQELGEAKKKARKRKEEARKREEELRRLLEEEVRKREQFEESVMEKFGRLLYNPMGRTIVSSNQAHPAVLEGFSEETKKEPK